MITITKPFTPGSQYPLSLLTAPESCLFFDIETTGFSREHHIIYLIGCASLINHQWLMKQWLAETPEEESEVLQAFLEYAAPFQALIDFNGSRFDLPFIASRTEYLKLDQSLSFQEEYDLLQIMKPYQKLLGMESCRQKSFEAFLKLSREDRFNGGELIPVYYRYCKSHREQDLHLLLLHNEEDVIGMTELTEILRYRDFFQQPFHYIKGCHAQDQLQLTFQSPVQIPQPFISQIDSWTLSAQDNLLHLHIPLTDTEMKHFYSDYQNYYYLPAEDMAVHKSVAAYVEKPFRKKACKSNCYTRHQGCFFPQPEPIWQPEFKTSYKAPLSWALWQEDHLNFPERLEDYLSKILQKFC